MAKDLIQQLLERAHQKGMEKMGRFPKLPGYETPPDAPPMPPMSPEVVPPAAATPQGVAAPPSVSPGAGIPPWMLMGMGAAESAVPAAAFMYPNETSPAADYAPPPTEVVKRSAADNFGSPISSGPAVPSASPPPGQTAGSILTPANKNALKEVKNLDDLKMRARELERKGIKHQLGLDYLK